MAWTQVGTGTSATITAGTGSQTVNLPGTPKPGDLVVVAVAGDISCANSVTSAGYTAVENGTGANPGAYFAYKVLTTAETTVAIARDGTILKSCVVQVWSGGNTASIVDAAWTGLATGSSANPNSGAITVVGTNSLVVTAAFLDDDDTTISSAPSGYSNELSANTGQSSTTVGSTVAIASLTRSAGSEDPGAWTLGSSDQWAAGSISFALQQPFAPSQTQGAATLTGYAPTVSVEGDSVDYPFTPDPGAVAVTGHAPAAIEDFPIGVGATALALTGHAPTLRRADSWFPRNDWAPLYDAGATAIEQAAGALEVTGHAPTVVEESVGTDYPFTPDPGALALAGYAPTVDVSYTLAPAAAALAVAGHAPTAGVSYTFTADAPELALTGHAPTLLELSGEVLSPSTAELTLTGYAPSVDVSYVPQAAALTISGQAPSVTQGLVISPASGSAALTGHAPTAVETQPPVVIEPGTGQLAVAGRDPLVDASNSVTVTFPFLANAQGFTGVPGAGTTMAWTGADGNPLGSLQTRTTGRNRTAVNTWTLSTDFASLGVPADKVITRIIAKSAQSRCTEYTTGRASSVAAVTLTPTGYAPITIAAARSFSALDGSWQSSTSADTTGLEIPSGSSLTITLGSTIATGNSTSAAVTLRQDNVTFTIVYASAKRLTPLPGAVSVTGYAPAIETSEPIVQGNSWFARLTGGANTWDLRLDGGGDGYFVPSRAPLALTGHAPTLEFGNPTLTTVSGSLAIVGYAPTITGPPITVGGADYLLSEPATLESASGRIITLGDKRPTPSAGALALTGHAPTLQRTYKPQPASGQATITGHAPAVARDYTIAVPAGGLSADGRAPSVPLGSSTITPAAGALAFTGHAPAIAERPLIEPETGTVEITGQVPTVSLNTVYPQTAGSAELTGYAPTLAETTQPYMLAGSASITGRAPTVVAARLLRTSAALASQGATVTPATKVRHPGSGALQSEQPLAFSGSGIKVITGSGDLASGPASLKGDVVVVDVLLVSEPAKMYGRGKVIPYVRPRPRVRPERVNRYHVVLKPSKRVRIRRPNQRKPTR